MEINSNVFKALSDDNRLEILRIIGKEEICACDLLENFNITQATFSYHMKVLTDAKLVKCYKKGVWCIYSINKDTMNSIAKEFKNLAEEVV